MNDNTLGSDDSLNCVMLDIYPLLLFSAVSLSRP
jgi:hypothetical protein